MPRIARAVATEFPHHIVQRGNNRGDVFLSPEDREKYRFFLKKYSVKWESPILAYCLMTNHIHLLSKPLKEESLHKMMQGVALCYTQYFNKTYGRTGRLWESRFHSCAVQDEHYLWAVARYIEQNPVRARISAHAEDYPYSSARAHVLGTADELLNEELFSPGLRQDYISLLRSDISESDLTSIRYTAKTGRPFGGESFADMVSHKLNRRLIPGRPGRPKK
ncbi:MAG: transposase [Nitrospirae bacterium]|nr:transposase [Nitrospirota bacterium]